MWSSNTLLYFLSQGFYFIFFFLGPHLQHMEVPRLGGESEPQLQLQTFPTATATPDPSCICDLPLGLWQHQILDPLREARGRTRTLTEAVSGP